MVLFVLVYCLFLEVFSKTTIIILFEFCGLVERVFGYIVVCISVDLTGAQVVRIICGVRKELVTRVPHDVRFVELVLHHFLIYCFKIDYKILNIWLIVTATSKP